MSDEGHERSKEARVSCCCQTFEFLLVITGLKSSFLQLASSVPFCSAQLPHDLQGEYLDCLVLVVFMLLHGFKNVVSETLVVY